MGERRLTVVDRGAWCSATATPHPALRGFFDAYVGYWDDGVLPRRMRTQPLRTAVLIINLGEPLRMVELPGSGSGLGAYTSFVTGLYDGPGLYESPDRQVGIQLDLTPLGAYTLLGVPMHELTNSVVDLTDVFGRRTSSFVTRLAETPDWAARFDLLDRLLLARLAEGPAPSPEVTRAWRLLDGTAGQVSVADLADDVGWSRKHLVDRFKRQVGLSPKVMARVLRFHRASDLMLHGVPNWVDIALTCGYYDQAHMNREFRALSGLTPTELLADRRAHYAGLQTSKTPRPGLPNVDHKRHKGGTMALPTIYPALRYKDAPAAIRWLVTAFGLTEHMVVDGPDNTIAHAQLAWGDGGMIMLGSTTDGSDGRLAEQAGPAWIYLVVDDPDAHHERAVAAGAEIVQPLTDEDYGSRGYTARDPEGNLWSFGTYQPATSPD